MDLDAVPVSLLIHVDGFARPVEVLLHGVPFGREHRS